MMTSRPGRPSGAPATKSKSRKSCHARDGAMRLDKISPIFDIRISYTTGRKKELFACLPLFNVKCVERHNHGSISGRTTFLTVIASTEFFR